MIRLMIMYPKTPDSRFDMKYYLERHVPLVQRLLEPFGMVGYSFDEGLMGNAPDQPATYLMIGSIEFRSTEDFQKAMAATMSDMVADVAQFTNVRPIVQVGHVLAESNFPDPTHVLTSFRQ